MGSESPQRAPSFDDDDELPAVVEKPKRIKKRRRVKREKRVESIVPEEILEVPGVVKLILSPSTQKSVSCVVGDDVTDENPWKFIKKEDLEYNLETLEDESDFANVKDTILTYPRTQMLVGYISAENLDFEEFYICTTVPAEETVTKVMERVMSQREERLNNTLIKAVRPWTSLGSEREVNLQIIRNRRALLEMECESAYPVMNVKNKFKLRLAEHVQNGYVEILCSRQTFTNVLRQRVDASVQVTPAVKTNMAQTNCNYPKNISTQYKYEYEEVKKLSKEFLASVSLFVKKRWDTIDDMMYVNSYINFYSNDYLNLAKDQGILQKRVVSSRLCECFGFFDHKVGKGRVINSLCWHDTISGMLAASYARVGVGSYRTFDPTEDEVLEAIYDSPPVLLWCFNDNLTAKLFLQSPRQVTALSFSPYEDNLLVGGCLNGQIIVWDITDRIKRVEQHEIITANQQSYRQRMFSLMTWMKDIRNERVVEATLVSDMQYSHNSSVTAIEWISPYREISRSGKITNIPEEEERTSRQFMTSSKDGTILCWDLLSKATVTGGSSYKPQRKLRRLKKRPNALAVDESPLKALNRIFRPNFKVIVVAPNTNRSLPILTFNIRITPPEYVEKYPDPNRKYNIQDSIYFNPILRRPLHPLANEFIGGSIEGDFFIAAWEGFEYNAGEVVNKETAKILNFGKYHDGPIVAVSRSEALPDIVLTVGGKVFAVWKTTFIAKPLFWRKSKHRYTHGSWNTYRPTIFRLTRDDGNVEMWHLKTRSDRFEAIAPISAGTLFGSFTHPRILKKNIIGIADCTSAIRLFHIYEITTELQADDVHVSRTLYDRELDRKLKFIEWQEKWKLNNADKILKKKEKEGALQKQREEMAQAEEERLRTLKEAEKEGQNPQPEGDYAERIHQDWKQKEAKRMITGLLHKKQLDMEQLLKKQVVILKLEEAERMLEQKKVYRQRNATKMFNEAVATFFPAAVEKKPPPPPDPYSGINDADVELAHFMRYQELAEHYENFVRERTYFKRCNWLNLSKKGKERRRWLDGYYSRTSHKSRLIREAEIEEGASRYVSPPIIIKKLSSSESLLYDDIDEPAEQ